MKSKKAKSNSSLAQKFDELKLPQEEKPKFQVILDKFEIMNSFFIEQDCQKRLSLDNSTESFYSRDL